MSQNNAKFTVSPLHSTKQTCNEMQRLVENYSKDLGDKAKWPLIRFFNYVKNLRYIPDPKKNETISRPKFLMLPTWHARDCDDKSILIASWCRENKIPWRFMASSTRDNKVLHHVFVFAKINGKVVPLDATYPKNIFGGMPYADKITKIQPLNNWN